MLKQIFYCLILASISVSSLYPTPSTKPMGVYVGELQERWQFPSDHIPVGITCDHLHMVSWNVLDTKCMHWVTEKNTQGLSRSLIADEHLFLENSSLTLRDQHVVALILQMLSHPSHPRSICALQECGDPFFEELEERLPSHCEVIHDGELVLVLDSRFFEVLGHTSIVSIFESAPQRAIQDVSLLDLQTGQVLRLINAHLPGDPTQPAPLEFALYLADTFDASITTIAMGDMNFNEIEMECALHAAFDQTQPFSVYSPYCTNISPDIFVSKAIDHFLFYSKDGSSPVMNQPDEVLPGLSAVTFLLSP